MSGSGAAARPNANAFSFFIVVLFVLVYRICNPTPAYKMRELFFALLVLGTYAFLAFVAVSLVRFCVIAAMRYLRRRLPPGPS